MLRTKNLRISGVSIQSILQRLEALEAGGSSSSSSGGGGDLETRVATLESMVNSIVPQEPTGGVYITGMTQENQELEASNDLEDPNQIVTTITYVWQRMQADGIAIAAASIGTSRKYTLQQADVGLTVRVQASYTDNIGTAHSVLSDVTAIISNINDNPTGTVTFAAKWTDAVYQSRYLEKQGAKGVALPINAGKNVSRF